VIVEALSREGLLTEENTISPLPCSLEMLALCHVNSYIETVQNEIADLKKIPAAQGECSLSTGDVQICSDSLDVALLACGAALKAVDIVMEGYSNAVFCPVRPPGHHATSNQGMGFCIFNNAAIAARYAIQKYGLKRVLIADWDVHHGNGTQEIFFHDPAVFYFSTHQAGIYPGTGHLDEIGYGNIMNCPIEGGRGSRLAVLKAFHEKLVPAMQKFHPELVIISAGFDAHVDDPLGGMDLTTDDFAELTSILKDISRQYSKGRVISLLEGGYNLNALAQCAVAHVKVLEKKQFH
jgi:acetoin utilization deacetylase AcuC-like enzyme